MTLSQQSPRYDVLGRIAQGGMASVHLARMTASTGFTRLVAIKRLHREYTQEQNFVAMLGEEARLSAHIRHANVIDTLDLAVVDGALSLVLEYVEGESLSALIKRSEELGEPIPVPIAVTIMHGVLRGLEAAHEARRDDGMPLAIVHRDVSPQNILVGIDGNARVIDFGIAKALDGLELTQPGEVRGKIAYMPPEQLLGRPVTRQVDVYAAGVVVWELLTGQRLYARDDVSSTSAAVLSGASDPPSTYNPDVPPELDAVVMRAISRDVYDRYLTAREFAADLEPWQTASEFEIGSWVSRLASDRLAATRGLLHGPAIDDDDDAQTLAPHSSLEAPIIDEPPTGTGKSGNAGKGGNAGKSSSTGTIVMPYTYTPVTAPPNAKSKKVPPALLVACAFAAVLACVFAVVVSRERGDAGNFEPSTPGAANPTGDPAVPTSAEPPAEDPGDPNADPSADPESVEPPPSATPTAHATSPSPSGATPATSKRPPPRPPRAAHPRPPHPSPAPQPQPASAPTPADDGRGSRNYR